MHYQQQLNLEWIKCQGNQWCNLLTVNLSHDHFKNLEGVYIIWHGGQNARVVYVGQGIIADRLATHREELRNSGYAVLGLFVTWAQVRREYRDGVERFLAEGLRPLQGQRYPEVMPIKVNLPW